MSSQIIKLLDTPKSGKSWPSLTLHHAISCPAIPQKADISSGLGRADDLSCENSERLEGMIPKMSHVHAAHLSLMAKISNCNVNRVSSMNYRTTAIRLIASSAIGLTLAATECWAQIPQEKSTPSPVETSRAKSVESSAPLNTNLPASDPDSGQALFTSLRRPVDDLKIYNTVSKIYTEQLDQAEQLWLDSGWSKVDLASVPASAKIELPKADNEQLSLDRICRATGVVALGGSPQNFSTCGAVIISPDGLAITNFHVASAINERIVIVLADGTVARVTKIIAGNPNTDVAIVQLDKQNLPWIPIAEAAPAMADPIQMLHHSEARYYTYDTGYVKRYPFLGHQPWMEISAHYAPGGSGCGIYNNKHELVGLVAIITMGDGPYIASQALNIPPPEPAGVTVNVTEQPVLDPSTADQTVTGEANDADALIVSGKALGAQVVKLAVPLSAIRSLIQ